MKKLMAFLWVPIMLLIGITGCDKHKHSIKVGTIDGPETQLMQTAQQVAKQRYHLNFDIVTFTDYNMPNAALSDGSIDANMFQHLPFLQAQIHEHHYPLIVIGKTFIYPMGIYSQKIKDLSTLPEGAHVAIPNDPSNEARALLLLEQAKLITLDPKAKLNATPLAITNNPHHLVFTELDAAQLPRSLVDVDLAVINTNYAISAHLSPTKDALFHEDKNSPYANVIVIRAKDKDNLNYQQLVKALQSKEVQEKARELFGDGAIPAF